MPAVATFFVVFFGIPVLARIGNLNRSPSSCSPREKFLLLILILLAVIALIVVVPHIHYFLKMLD